MKLKIDAAKEYGVVLEGGGAKGAYQIGVWRALIEAGIRIRGLAGTSVGGLNAAFICMSVCQMRKHVAWYTAGYPESAALRKKINEADSYEELRGLIEAF